LIYHEGLEEHEECFMKINLHALQDFILKALVF